MDDKRRSPSFDARADARHVMRRMRLTWRSALRGDRPHIAANGRLLFPIGWTRDEQREWLERWGNCA